MKIFTFSFKSLLLAAGLMLGSANAWAGETVFTYAFSTWGTSHMNRNSYATMGTTSAGFKVNNVDMYQLVITGTKDSEVWDLSDRFAVSNNVTYRWGSGGSDVPRLGNENASGSRYISIVDLKAGDKVVITCSNMKFYSTNATYLVEETPTAVVYDALVTSGTTYTITGEGTQRLDLWTASRVWANITNVVITREIPEGAVEIPESSITGANNNARTFTLSCATEGATIYYSETEKAAGAEGWTEYTAPVETEATYIWTYAAKAGMTSSDVARFATGAGSTISLKGATFSKPYYDTTDKSYFVKVSDDQNSLIGKPTASLVYYTNDPESTTPFTSGDVLSGFAPGTTLYVKASASGYGTTTTYYYFPTLTDYSIVWSDDFTSGEDLTVAAAIRMGNQDCQPITKIGETVLTGNVGVDNFNTTRFNSTTNGIWVKSSRYMGAINVFPEGLIKVTINKEGFENDYITNRKDVSTQYAVRSADGESYDIYYRPGNSSVTWNIFNGLYIKSVSFMAAPVSATVTSAGWATLYTPYALDFSEIDGLTAYTATEADGVVTLTAVDDVPANTGVVLKGTADTYKIPVIASSETDKGGLQGSATVSTNADAAPDGKAYYILTKSGEEAEFQAASGTIAAGKAYLVADWASGGTAKSLRVVVDGETTEVTAPEVAETEEEEVLFNMAGIQVDKNFKGFVINQKGVKRFNK